MKIPSFCEHCGRIIGTYDTDIDTSIDWLEKPCGNKVCDECCYMCERENTDGINFDSCPYKDEQTGERKEAQWDVNNNA